MLGQIKGYVIVDKEIKYTKQPGTGPLGIDMTKDYFEALQYRMVPILDIAVEGTVGNEYLVMGTGKESGPFLWFLDKRDTISEFIPYELIHPGQPSVEKLVEILKKLINGTITEEEIDFMLSKFKGA